MLDIYIYLCSTNLSLTIVADLMATFLQIDNKQKVKQV